MSGGTGRGCDIAGADCNWTPVALDLRGLMSSASLRYHGRSSSVPVHAKRQSGAASSIPEPARSLLAPLLALRNPSWKLPLWPCLPALWLLSLFLTTMSVDATWQLHRLLSRCHVASGHPALPYYPLPVHCFHRPPAPRGHVAGREGGTTEALGAPFTVRIVTVPRPFDGPTGAKQRQAISSWLQLSPKPQVVLLGRHPRLEEVSAEFPVGDVVTCAEVDTKYEVCIAGARLRSCGNLQWS